MVCGTFPKLPAVFCKLTEGTVKFTAYSLQTLDVLAYSLQDETYGLGPCTEVSAANGSRRFICQYVGTGDIDSKQVLVEMSHWTVRGPAIQSQSAGLSGPPAGGWGFQKRILFDKVLFFWS